MSLKAFHIFFIILSSALAFGGGLWALRQGEPAFWVAACFAVSGGLGFYLVWFIRKSAKLKS